MDDQFGGRTDDALFNDDFEPVQSEAIVVEEASFSQYAPEPTPVASTPAASIGPSRHRQPKPKKSSPSVRKAPSTSASQPQPQAKDGNLSSSRFARKGNVTLKKQPSPPATVSESPIPAKVASEPPQDKQPESKEGVDASPHSNASASPAKENKSHGSQNTAADAVARLGSGANPRQKLTEAELAAKMEQMKLLSAEKARKFEMAEKDEKQHAQAYAKGMEEARKRRAENAERKRRGEEDKRKLDDERAKNRERKLKAMGMKEGGWDEGKEAVLEEEARKGFRGANGGVRGAKRGGLGSSRFVRAEGQEHPDVDRFLDERHRDRGRGRGGRGDGRGRGDRGAFEGGPSSKPKPMSGNTSNRPAPALTVDEFPALPSDDRKKKFDSDAAAAPAYPPPKTEAALLSPSLAAPAPPGSKWDDEMEALDELKKKKNLQS